jgi:hypothetical protein
MTNYRLLLSFLSVLWFFPGVFNEASGNDISNSDTQKTETQLKLIETKNNNLKTPETIPVKAKKHTVSVITSPQKANQNTINAADSSAAKENNPIERDEFDKPLDLSIPFKGLENSSLKPEKRSAGQIRGTNIFASDTKNKSRPLELDGDLLMTPYPEAGRQQSVDGAGIVIKLKP